MIFITSNNANLLTFLFKEMDTSISVKKQISPYSYLLKFNSFDDEIVFSQLCENKNTTNYDLYLLVMPNIPPAFNDNVGTFIFANVKLEHEGEDEYPLDPGNQKERPILAQEDTRLPQVQLDELLDKVHKNGYDSLTQLEKDKLTKLSQ